MIKRFKQFVSGLALAVALPSSGIATTEAIKITQVIDTLKTKVESEMENVATLQVAKLDVNSISAKEIRDIFDKNHIKYHDIDQINWTNYPYKPTARFRIAYTDNAFLLHFEVYENAVRGVTAQDNGRVWEDSCVEFFVLPFNDESYYNFEFNCIGKLLLQGGAKNERELAPMDRVASVERWSSLGDQPFGIKKGDTKWELTAIIPFSALFRHSQKEVKSLKAGKIITANFYKCGDKHPTPHFLSWNRIKTVKPDFHRPEFFGTLVLD